MSIGEGFEPCEGVPKRRSWVGVLRAFEESGAPAAMCRFGTKGEASSADSGLTQAAKRLGYGVTVHVRGCDVYIKRVGGRDGRRAEGATGDE